MTDGASQRTADSGAGGGGGGLTVPIAALVFGSGYCALVYQTVWIRLLRLVFGASTAASAATLGIFMAGLGLGSVLIGRRADRSENGLRLYALLEHGIAAGAAISPFLIELARGTYLATGGVAQLGSFGANALRVVLTALALGIPTVLMGGTLPALAKAVAAAEDPGRRRIAGIYAANTLGAVLGAFLTAFLLLEVFGLTQTLWLTCGVNLIIAHIARVQAGTARAWPAAEAPAPEADSPAPAKAVEPAPAAHIQRQPLVLFAAGLVGFCFFVLELVWYRMLGPLLGGTSYTFGLILTMALLGIGLGGQAYAWGAERRRPTLALFALTCALEALLVLLPFAIGDGVALFAALTRPLEHIGLHGLALSWAMVTAFVVFLPAVVAGYQFPLLIGILGEGEQDVARQVGLAYACNTVGAIVGSLAGGFGLLPALSAPGAWRAMGAVLCALSVAAIIVALRRGEGRRVRPAAICLVVAIGLAAFAQGPTAFWRHAPIGVGRVPAKFESRGDLDAYQQGWRHSIKFEADGFESSVGLRLAESWSFIVGGKNDGNGRADAPTQVLTGLVGAILHPSPTKALVIGLGTGSTAGWLAKVPGITQVDAVELEPVTIEVAKRLDAVNGRPLSNDKVKLYIGDGREFLLTSKERYDLIISVPSNPYRAGIASLFSADFYAAVRERLNDGGILLQWVQTYEVDRRTIETVYATLGTSFPAVETWGIHADDVLLVSSLAPIEHDAARVRARLADPEAPFSRALQWTWGVGGIEGLYSGRLAPPEFAALMAAQAGPDAINTDDMPVLEFGFARGVAGRTDFSQAALDELAFKAGMHGSPLPPEALDWDRALELRTARILYGTLSPMELRHQGAAGRRVAARSAWSRSLPREVVQAWDAQPEPATDHMDLTMLCDSLARIGDPRTPDCAGRLAAHSPAAASLALTIWHATMRRPAEAADALVHGAMHLRTDPWPLEEFRNGALGLATGLASTDPAIARKLYDALGPPFAARISDSDRIRIRLELAQIVDPDGPLCLEAVAPFEPEPPGDERVLSLRAQCYQRTGHPLADDAIEDLRARRR